MLIHNPDQITTPDQTDQITTLDQIQSLITQISVKEFQQALQEILHLIVNVSVRILHQIQVLLNTYYKIDEARCFSEQNFEWNY